ncbi:MAG: diacylglycerol kinase family lipid kinase [Candidatus Tenebribacter mawsonii]|nr:diacylglycerol kinase family lipid kinase [Candidatus Tenebribacter mawsonii]
MRISDIKRYSVIFNPTADKGSAPKHIPAVNEFLQKHNINYEIHLTKSVGHATELAYGFAIEGNIVISAGGDGTCNEVINGLMKAKNENGIIPVFAVIPIGTGNDFAYGAHVPSTLQESLQAIIEDKTFFLDIGLVKGGDYPEGRYFGNGIGVGFDTIVGLEAAKLKHIHGALGYVIAALKTLIIYPPAPEVELKYDDSSLIVNPALVSIMNGNRMGGTFFMSPEANNCDGIFNLCMTKQGKRKALLKAMMHYMKGTQSTLADTTTLQSSDFHLRALHGELAVHADGETICEAGVEIHVECIPSALKIIR